MTTTMDLQIDLLPAVEPPPPARPVPTEPRGEAGMRAALEAHDAPSVDEQKIALVRALKAKALVLWAEKRLALSVNDVRHVMDELHYSGDARVLAAAFPRATWMPVGYVRTDSPGANQREVRTFIPRESYNWWRANTAEGREYEPRRARV